jgi:hypothetical protein
VIVSRRVLFAVFGCARGTLVPAPPFCFKESDNQHLRRLKLSNKHHTQEACRNCAFSVLVSGVQASARVIPVQGVLRILEFDS